MQVQQTQRAGWWQRTFGGRLTDDLHHWLFRLVSMSFTGGSAFSFYWVLGAHASDPVWHNIVIVLTVAFALYGYFALRGLAYRMLRKQRWWSYGLITVIYLFVEVSCNLMHAVAGHPDVLWLQKLDGQTQVIFSVLWTLVMSMFPLLNAGLGIMDADLAQEKLADRQQPHGITYGGTVPAKVVPPGANSKGGPAVPGKAPQQQPPLTYAPQTSAAYPTQTFPNQGQKSGQYGAPNTMKTHYQNTRGGAPAGQMAANGASGNGGHVGP